MTPHDEAVEAALDAFYGKGMWPTEATREELIHDMRRAIAAYEAAMAEHKRATCTHEGWTQGSGSMASDGSSSMDLSLHSLRQTLACGPPSAGVPMNEREVEAVARAICSAGGAEPDKDARDGTVPSQPVPTWTLYREDARAAIAALDALRETR